MKKFLLTLACMLSVCLAALAQNVLVKGVVTDAVTKETIPGAAILVNGAADNGTVTDHEGKYEITVAPGARLVCQQLGYANLEKKVPEKGGVLNFALEEDSQLLDGTVVVGYGTLKKSQLVGSVENVSGEVLEDRSNSNITRSLQGQVPGLNIIQVDGKPTHG